MTETWRPQSLVLASAAGVGLLTMVLAIATVALIITDPIGTAGALSARNAAPMFNAIASLIWRAIDAVLAYI